MFAFRKHDAMCSKRHFVTIMHPDHSRHSSSFTFQMGFLLFLCFLIETSSRRKKKPKRENILVKASPIANYFSVYCACGCKKGMCVCSREPLRLPRLLVSSSLRETQSAECACRLREEGKDHQDQRPYYCTTTTRRGDLLFIRARNGFPSSERSQCTVLILPHFVS